MEPPLRAASYGGPMEPLEHYDRVSAGFGMRLEAVGDWSATTPCPDWDAKQLASHVVDTHNRVLSRLDGSEPVLLGDGDALAAFAMAQAAVRDALTDERADMVVNAFTGEAPWSTLVDTLLCADTLLHTWDLARTIKADDTLDLASVAAAYSFLSPMGDMMRSPGGFGPEVVVAADASAQDQLLGFTGRTPDAPAP